MQRPKPEIIKFNLTEEQKQDISNIMEGKTTSGLSKSDNRRGMNMVTHSPKSRQSKIDIITKKYFKGSCHICRDWPMYKVVYHLEGASLREFYCEKHMSSELIS
jgi:hypothetical protein